MTCGADISDQKASRCRAAKCPLAGSKDARCAQCTGPVAWTDARGVKRGRARACTDCPMDGLGLPVCWAACPGPNDGYQTDGQSMVTLGGMPDADAYVERFSAEEARRADSDVAQREDRFGGMARGFAAGLMRLDSRGWDALKDACARMDARAASALMGVPLGMFRGPRGGWDGSVADRVMGMVGGIGGDTWEQVRGVLSGRSQSDVARLGLVTKQAVSKRMKKAARRETWLARLLAGE
ncbi:MAG: hypothetical protein IIZ06_06790 [Kiritimatiellae bacterium]|nr:hypothetical protein [Kiritimatiellia bacterium]